MFPLHWICEPWLLHLITSYGAWAVFACVALESTGLPVPSESILIAVAATTAASDPHAPAILTIVLAAAAAAAAWAVLGDNLGYWGGRNVGAALVQRYGSRLSLTARRQRLGRFLFHRYGAQVVFVARFVSLLRTCLSLLAGIPRMP